MKLDEFFLFATSACLGASSAQRRLEIVNRSLAAYQRAELRVPGVVSLGARVRGPMGPQEYSFDSWLERFPADGTVSVDVHALAELNLVTQAFAGPGDHVMVVSWGSNSEIYRLDSTRSLPWSMTPKDFAQLIDAQTQPGALWDVARTFWAEFLQSNGLEPIAEPISQWCHRPEAADSWDYLLPELLNVVQAEAFLRAIEWIVPDSLRGQLEGGSLSPAQPLEGGVWLYALAEVPGEVLVELVEAQTGASEVWQACIPEKSWYPEIAGAPDLAGEWPDYVRGADATQMVQLTAVVLGKLSALADQGAFELRLPQHLAVSFGPPAEEFLAARVRRLVETYGFVAAPATTGWEQYWWLELPGTPPAPPLFPWADLSRALSDLYDFAERERSGFAQAFLLANFFLKAGDRNVNDPRTLAEAEFSTQARAKAASCADLGEVATLAGWTQQRANQLIAVIIADVFGGMGSWNDTFLGDGEEQARLTQRLFQLRPAALADVLCTRHSIPQT